MTRSIIGALLGGLAAAFASAASAAATCDVASLQAASPADTTIVSAVMEQSPVANCKVEGYVTTTNPGPNRNGFRVQLPDRGLWNGRFYFMGLGGAAGSMPPAPPKILGAGFVVAVTDTGHQADTLDWTFMQDPAKALDHIHRGGHVTTVASQQITRAYYGVAKIWRYHVGCSGGGRMGEEAARHHPEDYDGILAGSGGGRAGRDIANAAMLKFVHVSQVQSREPGAWVSPAKLKMVEAHVTAACDATDGAVDGVVWDHRLCRYDVAKLQCKAGDQPDCLTGPEVGTIKAILRGPRDSKGRLLSAPMPISNMSMWAFNGAKPPPWRPEATAENLGKGASTAFVIPTTMARGMVRPDYDILKDFDFSERAIAEWDAGFRKTGFNLPLAADKRPLEAAGGKILMWSGRSDPCCAFEELEQTYNDTVRFMGNDRARVDRFAALYGIPGMGHCGGGTGPEDAVDMMLATLIDWVEKGQAPGPIVMHRGADRVKAPFEAVRTPAEAGVKLAGSTGVSRDFLVCRYPLVSVFDTSKAKAPGAVNEAANWSCRPAR